MNLTLNNHVAYSTLNGISKKEVYLGPGFNYLPTITNLIYTIPAHIDNIEASFIAKKLKDKEGLIENVTRVVTAPLLFAEAIASLGFYIIKAGSDLFHFLPKLTTILTPLSRYLSGLGIILGSVEFALETSGWVRQIHFFNQFYPKELSPLNHETLKSIIEKSNSNFQLNRDLKKYFNEFSSDLNELNVFSEIGQYLGRYFGLEPSQEAQNVAKRCETAFLNIQAKYFRLSSKKEKKIELKIQHLAHPLKENEKKRLENIELIHAKTKLVRRVHSPLSTQITNALEGNLLKRLNSSDVKIQAEAICESLKLLENVKIQSEKKMLVYKLGALAALLVFIGSIFTLVCSIVAINVPPLVLIIIPFLIFSIGGIFSTARYLLNQGLLEQEGWVFDPIACLPHWIEQRLSPEIKSHSLFQKKVLKLS